MVHLMKHLKGADLHLTDKYMRNLLHALAAGTILTLTFASCHSNNSPAKDQAGEAIKNDSSVMVNPAPAAGLLNLADTITYDVNLYNLNPDDAYADRFLKHLKPEILINGIFDALYSGKMKAFDIATNKELTIGKIKEIEKAPGFSRTKIGKIQFTESWSLNPASLTIEKKVISMAFGYAHTDASEGIVAYDKPLFRVYIK
jgi:hypothetical protein